MGTERHESRRIDNQLRGRSGRQGDEGESRFFLSVEDDLMRVFAGDRLENLMRTLNVDENTPIEETMAVCNMLKKKGKIRYIGMSNSSKELIQEAQKYAKIDVIQPPFSIVNQSERELMEWAETQGIGTMTYGSLGGGILTGAIRELPKPDPKDMRQVFYPFFKEPVFSNVMELLKTLDKIAEAHNVPVAQVSINWSTQKSFVGTALTGVNTPAQADENCSAFEWQLNNEEIALIDSEIDRLNIG